MLPTAADTVSGSARRAPREHALTLFRRPSRFPGFRLGDAVSIASFTFAGPASGLAQESDGTAAGATSTR